MKKMFLMIAVLGLSSASAFASNVCVEVPNTCASHGEVFGCEGGYKGYASTQLEFIHATGAKEVAFKACLEKLNDLSLIESKLYCNEIPNTCASHGEVFGCEGGYGLLEVDTNSSEFFPRTSHANALEACESK